MDTLTSLLKQPQSSLPKRPLLFLGLGGVLGIILVYGVLPANNPAAPAVLGIGLLAAVAVAARARRSLPAEESDGSGVAPIVLSESQKDWPELVVAHHSLDDSLRRLAGHTDSILLEAAIVRLAAIQEEVRSLADGRIVFAATESWRTIYEQMLRSPDIDSYRSVAWMRNEDYWQDAPGQRSMQTNYERLQEGVSIERILILCDFFWPAGAALPVADIRRWIDEQYKRGIRIGLVRESDIAAEADLLCDIGIYGSRATGTLELDSQCRTTRFTFDFSPEGIRLAEERWKRLSLYAISYGDLLDRSARRA